MYVFTDVVFLIVSEKVTMVYGVWQARVITLKRNSLLRVACAALRAVVWCGVVCTGIRHIENYIFQGILAIFPTWMLNSMLFI